MRQTIAYRAWVQDVAKPLVFEWVLLALITLMCAVFGVLGGLTAMNALFSGAAIAVPHTTLGAWMGVRILLGKSSPLGVFTGSVVKTLFSIVLIGAAFAALQELGFVWQGFMAGLVGMAMSTALYGLFGASLEKTVKKIYQSVVKQHR